MKNLIAWAVLVVAGTSSARSDATERCSRVSLESPPASIAGAIWQRNDAGLVLLNNGTRSLDLYDLKGKRERRVSSPGSGPLDFNVPLAIAATDSGYVLNDENHHFVWLDASFRQTDSFDFETDRPAGADELWLDGQSIVTGREAVGLLSRNSRDGVDFGIFRLKLQKDAQPQVLEPIPMPGDRGHHSGSRWRFRAYQTVYRYIARVGDRVYWLRLDGDLRLHLVELDHGGVPTEVGVIPATFAQWPRTLPEDVTVQDVPGILKALETSTIISQLMSDGERLFLLGHAPSKQGVRWTVFSLDSSTHLVRFEKDLPTTAADVLLLPGKTQVAAIEFGAIEGHLRPPVSVLYLPRKWFANVEGKAQWETECRALAGH